MKVGTRRGCQAARLQDAGAWKIRWAMLLVSESYKMTMVSMLLKNVFATICDVRKVLDG